MSDRDPIALKIVHVVPSLNVAGGGPARSVIRLAGAQQRLGTDVSVVTGDSMQASGEDAEDVSALGVEIRGCPLLPLPFEIPSAGMVRVLAQEIRRADVVHLHSLWNGTVTAAARVAQKFGVPYIISPRGMLDPAAVQQRRALKHLYRALFDRATSDGAAGFHFLTPDERDTALWPPRVGQGIAVIPNGVDVEAVNRAAASEPGELFPAERTNLLYLGRLHQSKGLGLQVDALGLLQAQGIDAELFFVGPDDGEAAGLTRRARASGLERRVHVAEPVYSDRRFALLRAADCVLLTSHFEGNSVSAMETMAAGGLLVATDTTHLGEAARHDAAVVVKRTATAVADAVAGVLNDRELGKSVRRHALEYARAELESAVIARRMLSFYNEVLEMSLAVRARA